MLDVGAKIAGDTPENEHHQEEIESVEHPPR